MGRDRWKPNRISSLGLGCPDWFKLDQRVRWVRRERYCTVVNCNPNCNPNCQPTRVPPVFTVR
jgi:hypothetical protein